MGKTIKLDHITKIEGHANLTLSIDDGKVKKCELGAVEGSRYFEGMLKGRDYKSAAWMASRICGICSPVHGLTSVKATEKAMGIQITPQTELLRELLNIGGTIQSHVLHLYFLTLPDYTGFPNAVQMAQKHPEKVKRALKIKQLGNELVRVIGGRDIHPFTLTPGGFVAIPKKEEFQKLLADAKACLTDAKKTAELFCGLDYPDFTRETKHYALKAKKGCYWCPEDTIICTGGKECIAVTDYEQYFKEFFKQGSTSEFAKAEHGSYMVGAWSRILNNYDELTKEGKEMCRCILPRQHSPFMNNPAQAIEIYEGIRRVIDVLENTEFKEEKPVVVKTKAGVGIGANEAPRGIVFHKYKYDKDGFTNFINITTPTTQNLQNLEDDIKHFLPTILDKPKEEIQLEIEKLIRAYDPCISCATHFLEIIWE